MPINLDTTHFPVFIIKVDDPLLDTEQASYLEACTKHLFSRNLPFVFIYDARGSAFMTATQRRQQADWLNEQRDKVSKLNKGCAFLLSSAVQRGTLTAVHWVSPPPYPYYISDSWNEGLAWALSRLRAEGIDCPPAHAIPDPRVPTEP